MNLRRIYAMILLFLIGMLPLAVAQPTWLESGSIAKTLKLPDGATFAVTVSVGKWRGDPYKSAQLWGAWGKSPMTVISRVAVSRNREPLYVPFSSYADLADPLTVEVRLKGNDVELEISGAREGDRYRALLLFTKGMYLSSRKVESSEMPKDAREETKYFGVENR